MAMDMIQTSVVDTTACSKSKSKPESRVPEARSCSCKCTYDFAVVHGDKDKELAEKFFSVLEGKYELKGYHSKRDCVAGVIKQRQLVEAWQVSSFILELISIRSVKNKVFQKYRSIAHEVESKKSKKTNANHPEVLPIYVDIPQKEQRGLSTRVGRTFSDTVPFWDELASHILNNHSCIRVISQSSVDSNQNDSSSEAQVDLTNNNDLSEKPLPVKCRKKHKIFRGLFKSKKKALKRKLKRSSSNPQKSKSSKRKSKKKLKSFRKLLVCVPARSSECSYSSPPVNSQPVNGQPLSTFQTPDTAMVDEVEHDFMETTSRMD